MDLIKKTITARLLNKLPSDKKFIDPQWLNGYDIPGFVVERIKFELNRNLEKSIVTPRTDWADMNTDAVRDAWYQFVEALESETRLPVEFAGTVIENAVGDILNLLVEPRKYLPDYLFEEDETLDFRQVSDRVRNIVVYTHFGLHLPNYMQRKQLDTINRERFSSFICQLDEKLTSQYSPLNWAQLLAPLFELTNHTIEAELIARFFRDKERDILARKFDNIDEKINQTRFIEILTASDVQPKPEPASVSKTETNATDEAPADSKNDISAKAETPADSKTDTSAKAEVTADSKTDVKPKTNPNTNTKTDPVPLFISDNEPDAEHTNSGETDLSDAKPVSAGLTEKHPAKDSKPEPETGTETDISNKTTDYEPEPVEIPELEPEPEQEPEQEPEPAVSGESTDSKPGHTSSPLIEEAKETQKIKTEPVPAGSSSPDREQKSEELVAKKRDSDEQPAIPEPSQTRTRSSGIEFSSSSADSSAQPSAVPSAPQPVTSTPLWEKFRKVEDDPELPEKPDEDNTVTDPVSSESDSVDAAPLWKKFQPDAEENDNRTVKPTDSMEPKPVVDTYARTAAHVRSQQLDKVDVKPAVTAPPADNAADMESVESRSGKHAGNTASPGNESINEIPLVDRFKPIDKNTDEKHDNRVKAQDSVPDFTDENDGEQLPMWKRFISAAKGSRTTSESESDSRRSSIAGNYTSDDSDLDIEISNPLRIDEITKTLENKKKYYIKRFFRGDHAAFNTVIRDLSEMDSWNEAGPYITRNVFKKNKIDPYSDEAVNFIDRLQSYFTAQNQK